MADLNLEQFEQLMEQEQQKDGKNLAAEASTTVMEKEPYSDRAKTENG